MRALIGLALLAMPLFAAGKFTAGPPKLVLDVGAHANEGPSWDPAGFLYFVGASRVWRLDLRANTPAKAELFANAAGANTSVVDPEGRVLVCENAGRRVTRTDKNGVLTVLADRYQGHRLNSPNDLTFDSKGRIYFTDPRYGPRDDLEMRDQAGDFVEGVYRIDAPGKITRIITHETERPNGILITPGDRYMYIADNNNNRIGGARKLYRFAMRPDGTIVPGSRKLIFDWKGARGPDGLKMDIKGRLYVAAGLNQASQWETTEFKAGLYILSASGKLLEFVPLPKDEATNCSFGGSDLKTLFVTAGDQLWSIPMRTPGIITARR